MPQMSPMNWLFLYMMFIMTFILFSIINYYIFIPAIKKFTKKSLPIDNLTWKW